MEISAEKTKLMTNTGQPLSGQELKTVSLSVRQDNEEFKSGTESKSNGQTDNPLQRQKRH